MRLLLVLSVCYGICFYIAHSAFLRKPEASDFLAIVGKRQAGDGPCSAGRCSPEEDEDFDQNLRVRYGHLADSSSAESAMIPQAVLPTPAEGTAN